MYICAMFVNLPTYGINFVVWLLGMLFPLSSGGVGCKVVTVDTIGLSSIVILAYSNFTYLLLFSTELVGNFDEPSKSEV